MLSAQPHVMIHCMVVLFSWQKKVSFWGGKNSILRFRYQLQGHNLNSWEESCT